MSAKKVFLSNGGGNDIAYDAFYAAVKDWARFEIVAASTAADIVMQISYVTEDPNGQTDGLGLRREVYGPQLVLTITDPISKESLWSTVKHPRLAVLERNRDKNTVEAVQKLVENLKTRLDAN